MTQSNDTPLKKILESIHEGATRLPEFQRDWVWDDEHIRALIASITCSYPIGAVMFLEYGGEENRFKPRLFENVSLNVSLEKEAPKLLVLDGQQRLTAAYCAMYSPKPVPPPTIKNQKKQKKNQKNDEKECYYYLDIDQCLSGSVSDRIEGVISVPADKKIVEGPQRKLVKDLSTIEKEIENHLFPLNIVFDTAKMVLWQSKYLENYSGTERTKFLDFLDKVWQPILEYHLPVITLGMNTPKEAVCQVFEHVNTGGVPLTVFELVTAIFATDGIDLRKEWEKQANKMKHADGTFELLSEVAPTDFLASMTLLAQVRGNRTLAVKRKNVMELSLTDYNAYAEDLTDGYIKAALFLVQQNILAPRDLPYTTQLVPLAVLMTVLGNKTNDGLVKDKLAAWYWCGVFGEMYGSANETRYVKDVSGVLAWISSGEAPDTVSRAFFQPKRLLSLQTRNGAAYKGVMALILGEGARDFISGDKMDLTNFLPNGVDIHHIFPQKFCKEKNYDEDKWNCIVNKTPIAALTNKKLGGKAPSKYLKAIENDNVSPEALYANIESHGIDVASLREDDFDKFFLARAKTIVRLIYKAMGKRADSLNSPDVIEAFGGTLE